MPKIVLLNGPAGSGKDTLANHLASLSIFKPAHIMKFSEPLKIATHAQFNLVSYNFNIHKTQKHPYVFVRGYSWYLDCVNTPSEDFLGYTPKHIYDLLIPKMGNDENQANYYIAIHALFGLYSYDYIEKVGDKTYVAVLRADYFEYSKDLQCHLFNYNSPRAAYIQLSEYIVKPYFDDEFFGKVFCSRLKLLTANQKLAIQKAHNMNVHFDYDPFIFVSDSGFEAEARPLLKEFHPYNCLLLIIDAAARGKTFEGDSRSYIELPINTEFVQNNLHGQTSLFFKDAESILINWLES
jgi:energy-coupling factor transporter ATP-binding protein EcfA2